MTWFVNEPRSIRVGTARFLLAEEALWAAESVGIPEDLLPKGDRDSPDWGATAVMFMVRQQLLQLRDLVDMTLDLIGLRSPSMTLDQKGQALESALETRASVDDQGDWAFAASCIHEALSILEALEESRGMHRIDHAFASDGSIALTTGPEIPECAALSLHGSDSMELNDEPSVLFERAATSTKWAAEIYEELRRSAAG